jgi:hypothetical protein
VYVDAFNDRLDTILHHGWQEYEVDKERLKNYGASSEKSLLNRIEKYRENYFAWVEDFSLPTTNNLSERSLRSIKSKMKISGQFESEEYAQYFATIRTYIETCRRRKVNEIEALTRLCEGRPFTVDELFSKKKHTGRKIESGHLRYPIFTVNSNRAWPKKCRYVIEHYPFPCGNVILLRSPEGGMGRIAKQSSGIK